MKDNGNKYPSFQYTKSFDSKDLDHFIISAVLQEKKHTNLARFNKGYIQKHKTFFTLGQSK